MQLSNKSYWGVFLVNLQGVPVEIIFYPNCIKKPLKGYKQITYRLEIGYFDYR